MEHTLCRDRKGRRPGPYLPHTALGLDPTGCWSTTRRLATSGIRPHLLLVLEVRRPHARGSRYGQDQSLHHPYVTVLQTCQGLAQGTRL